MLPVWIPSKIIILIQMRLPRPITGRRQWQSFPKDFKNMDDCIQEALDNYNIAATEIELLRHNENLTYRVGNEYLLQIHEPAEGFSAEFITTVLIV